ncbi:Fc receptor-like protein 5 isoform 1-T2 [Discoglossus pictus]
MHDILPGGFYLSIWLFGGLNLYEAVLDPPSISFTAGYATYLIGEPLYMICKVPAKFPVDGYQFFRNNQELKNLEGESTNQYSIYSVNRQNTGTYTCQYWVSNTRGRQTSVPSDPLSLIVLDQPSTPSLLVKPEHSLYFEGESVTLQCEHADNFYPGGYKFYKDNMELKDHGDTLRSQHIFQNLSTKDTGKYDCQYWISVQKRTIRSARSIPKSLDVTAVSAPPLLKITPPYSVFVLGETFTMECMAPSPISATVYRYYKDGRELGSEVHTLQNATKDLQGKYICIYWSTKHQREIPSTQSPVIDLSVIDPLLPPLLTMDPPNGRIRNGGNVTLFCTVPIYYKRTTFHFLSERREILCIFINRTQMDMTVTIFKHNNVTYSKKYSCQYTAEIRGRALMSPESHEVEIIVIAGSMLWLIAIAVAAGIIVLIIVFFLLYWILKAREGTTEAGPESRSSDDGRKFSTLQAEDEW